MHSRKNAVCGSLHEKPITLVRPTTALRRPGSRRSVCGGPHPDCPKATASNKYMLAAERSCRPAPAVRRSRGPETKTLCGEWPFTPSDCSASVRNRPLQELFEFA